MGLDLVLIGWMTLAASASPIEHVFIVAMENHSAAEIYGNTRDAPYLNGTLLKLGGRATNYIDSLPKLDSEPHYVWIEAGTNAFADHTFVTDDNPSASNSTASAAHVVTQLRATSDSWRAYEEGLNAQTGACPIAQAGFYYPKHDPFVFFRDVAGDPPSKTAPYCAEHHSALSALGPDLSRGAVARYVFITPDNCHDMHGGGRCPESSKVRQGDDWLKANLPAVLAYATAHRGLVLILWDEPETDGVQPFLVLGPHVKPNYASAVRYSHGSVTRSLEEILGLPILPTVASETDLADFFEPGFFPTR